MASRFLLLSTVLLLACAPSRPRATRSPPSAHRITGLVTSEDGRPAAHAIVIASELENANEIGLAYTDADGRFAIEASADKYSLAAATPHAFAFVPDAHAKAGVARIELSTRCAPFRGRIALEDPRPWPKLGILRIGGFSPDVLGLFGVEPASDGSFEACLPQGEYYLVLSADFADRSLLTMVPPVVPLEVHAASRAYSKAPPVGALGTQDESRAEMLAHLPGTVRVLGLGESNHGTGDYTNERVELVLALARQRQFTLLLIEAGYGEVLALDAYLQGADIQINDAMTNLGYWIWNTQELLDALNKLRAYNAGVAAPARIHIIGVDINSTQGAIAELSRMPGEALSTPVLQLLARLADQKGKPWLSFSADDRALTRRALDGIAMERDAGGIESARNRRALAARALLLAFDQLERQGFWDETRARDLAMARMVSEVLSLDAARCATVWAHLLHLAREYNVGAPTMGSHLAAALGAGYQAWGLLGYEGEARARSFKHNRDVIVHTLAPAVGDSVESVLSRSATRGLAVAYWALDRQGVNPWFRGLHWLRDFGAYMLDDRPYALYNLAALDGVVLFRRIHPSVPLGPPPPLTP